MSQTSDTPMTDAAEVFVYGHIDRRWVKPELARHLERELHKAKANIEALTEYARHAPACPSPHKPCDCGLSKLLEEIKA